MPNVHAKVSDKVKQLRLSRQLPSPKGVALAIMEISQREDAQLGQVVRLVQTDPALSARLLRIANAASKSGRAVASIEDAVMRLGMNVVRQLSMGFSLIDQYSHGPCKRFDYERFWSHSLLMGVACQELGKVVRAGTAEELFSCGLMAQIGQLAMATIYPEEYSSILAAGPQSAALIEKERAVLEVDHIEFTVAILEDCGIPGALTEPICFHEMPGKSGFAEGSRGAKLTDLFQLARCIADVGVSVEASRQDRLSELMRLGGKMGLDVESFGAMFDQIVRDWQQWAEVLKVPSFRLPTFTALANAPAPTTDQAVGATRKRVLVVDDDRATRTLIESALRKLLDCEVHTAADGKEALKVALDVMPQIIITDWLMPAMDGIDFCRTLRATEWGQSMYVIMMTSQEAEDNVVAAFEAGVDDYILKPINMRALNARMRAALHYVRLLEIWEKDRAQLKQFAAELAVSNRRFEQAAMTDLLTGLPNRRAGMADLAAAWSASQRTERPVSVLIVDIDFFKAINDERGHAAGDVVLQEIAKVILASARKYDRPSRMGGEEFLLVCHNTAAVDAAKVAARLKAAVNEMWINIDDKPVQVSVSIGIAERDGSHANADDLVRCADMALYAAKRAGRDAIFVYREGKAQRVVAKN